MKQLLQYIRTGQSTVVEAPAPQVGPGQVLVHTAASLVSAGTERMVVDFAEKNLLQKAKARPDLVRQTLDKAQREGLLTTLEAVQNRLDQPMALGYSCAGTVIEVGQDVTEFQVGNRVACAGGGHAVHAEVVTVPRNLAAKIPDIFSSDFLPGHETPISNLQSLTFEEAAFTTLGAIALQGIRLAEIRLGEVVAVIGLGLLGQLTVQMLKAAGCRVVGMDLQPQRAELARQMGADAVAADGTGLAAIVQDLSNGHGADAVLITAETTSDQPVILAGELAREKGIVVAVGTVGMHIPRKIYYEKELDFRISRSYGPGRYDLAYEEKGQDYPYAYVRWTEQRNMQAFLQLMAEGKVKVQPLITHRFPIDRAADAYALITAKTGEPFLGVLLVYPDQPDLNRKIILASPSSTPRSTSPISRVRLGLIGAGNFANATLLPALKRIDNLELVGVASARGVGARSTADRFGFAYCTTDTRQILTDPDINTVAIVTRNHLHAEQTLAALLAGKHVFVEKPLCLTEAELQSIVAAYRATRQDSTVSQQPSASVQPALMVGYNRRFAPFVVELKQRLQSIDEPLLLHYRVNAGYIPPEHWLHDPSQGGGRLLGEACHFIDLLIYLAGSAPQQITTRSLPDRGRYRQDNLLMTLKFANGSLATVSYLANGDKGFGKEFLEVFGGGLSARLDDYRTLWIRHGSKQIKRVARLRQDKGHRAEWQAWSAHLTGVGPLPISFEDIICSTDAVLAAQQSLRNNGEPVVVDFIARVVSQNRDGQTLV